MCNDLGLDHRDCKHHGRPGVIRVVTIRSATVRGAIARYMTAWDVTVGGGLSRPAALGCACAPVGGVFCFVICCVLLRLLWWFSLGPWCLLVSLRGWGLCFGLRSRLFVLVIFNFWVRRLGFPAFSPSLLPSRGSADYVFVGRAKEFASVSYEKHAAITTQNAWIQAQGLRVEH